MIEILRDGLRPIILVAMLACGALPVQAASKTLMLFGDSLMAGYGLPAADGFAAQLEDKLKADGFDVSIVNASVSGDTSAAGLARLDWSLADKPDAVLLEFGGNDMLRGLPPKEMADNLTSILKRLRNEGIPVLLMGMRASPGLGANYVSAFDGVFPRPSKQFDVPLYPFFLEGVAADPALNQADRIHPNAQGVGIIVGKVLPAVETLLSGL